MLSIIPKEIQRRRFHRDLMYWLLPTLATIVLAALVVFVLLPQNPEGVGIFAAMLWIVFLWNILWAILMVPVIFFEWFPAEYYKDLTECPVCGEEEVKCVNDCKCFSCGANKEEMDAIGVAG